jgi:hypothetical protein
MGWLEARGVLADASLSRRASPSRLVERVAGCDWYPILIRANVVVTTRVVDSRTLTALRPSRVE